MVYKIRRQRQGFTLIELLVVIAIIGILAGMVLISMNSSRPKARDARRMADFRSIPTAEESVLNDNYVYFSAATSVGSIPTIVNNNSYTYLSSISDPLNTPSFKYVWVGNTGTGNCNGISEGQYFCALTKLELPGSCTGNQNHYFVVNQKGAKEICDASDYVTNPPDVCACVTW